MVWEQLDSQEQLTQWSVHVWNRDAGRARQLATTVGPDGKIAAGQQALPVVWDARGRHARAAWAQPVPGTGPVTSELRVEDLGAGENTDQVRVLATGRLSSPVLAGGMLVWASLDSAGAYAFHAVDTKTLAPLPLPPQLANPGTIGYLAGSGDYLAWSDKDAVGLTVWHLGTQDVRRSRPAMVGTSSSSCRSPVTTWCGSAPAGPRSSTWPRAEPSTSRAGPPARREPDGWCWGGSRPLEWCN